MEDKVFEDGGEVLSYAEFELIMREYEKRQMIENMTGPGISLVSHMVLLLLAFVFIATSRPRKDPPLVVKTVVIEEIELDKELIDEIEEIDEDIENDILADDPVEAPSDVTGEITSPVDVSDDAPMTDDQTEMEDVLDIVKTKSPLHYIGSMGGRSDAGRMKNVGRYGGSKGGQASVNRALRWLARVQNADGSWGDVRGVSGTSNNGGAAHTGLALLVFLAHGETPLSETYGKTVQNAMRWLAEYGTQNNLNVNKRPMGYAHGIATYAIAEAYAMTKIPFMQTAMENCVYALIEGQMGNGGFGYGYTSGPRWDMSVAGWNMQALKAARMAGSTHPELSNAIRKSIQFCKGDGYKGGGKFAYCGGGPAGKNEARQNMTGVGVVALQLLGAGDVSQVREGCALIGDSRLKQYESVMADPSKWESIGSKCLYGWYYDTQAMFNSQNVDKARWKRWRNAFETVLMKAQHDEGYWETKSHGTGASTQGRVLSTCWSALQLEVYYRYLPSFDMEKINKFSIEDNVIDQVGDDSGMIIEIE